MESSNDMQKLLKQLEASSSRQLKYSRLQCYFAAAAAVCCLILLVVALGIMPQLRSMSSDVIELAEQAETVLGNLETVTGELAEADLNGMVEDVGALVSDSQSAVNRAAEKFDSIDMETLNKAIRDLADVVEPLANFFNIFN